MSYARRHSTNVCPGNRVRYNYDVTALIGEGGMGQVYQVLSS